MNFTYINRSEWYPDIDNIMTALKWRKFDDVADTADTTDVGDVGDTADTTDVGDTTPATASTTSASIPTLVYEDGKNVYASNSYRGAAVIKSVLSDTKNIISNKSNLYRALIAANPTSDAMMTQYRIPGRYPTNLFDNGAVWILKPVGVGFCKGKGISVVRNSKELERAVKPKVNYVLAKYITNPLLYRSYKFHIRVNALITTKNQRVIMWKLNNARLAIKSFTNSKYFDAGIHDTHFTTLARMKFTPDLEKEFGTANITAINDQISTIVNMVFDLFVPTAYPESTHAFEIFGFDFMVTSDYAVKLLEVNSKVSLEHYDPEILFNYIVSPLEELVNEPAV